MQYPYQFDGIPDYSNLINNDKINTVNDIDYHINNNYKNYSSFIKKKPIKSNTEIFNNTKNLYSKKRKSIRNPEDFFSNKKQKII